jgi:hypothetical protein
MSKRSKEGQVDTHPWTMYEIARARDEARLLRARAAMVAAEAREARRGEPGPDSQATRSWLGRILRRETGAQQAPVGSEVV